MKSYEFTTANGETCTFEIVGESYDGTADVAVSCGDYYREWDEVDAGSVDEMFADLLDSGVRFETKRSLVANIMVVGSVMLDRDSTIHEVIAKVDAMGDEEIDAKLDYYVGTTEVTAPKSGRQLTREEAIEHGEYLGFTEYRSGATEQRWLINGLVFAEICNARGFRTSWRCLGRASRVLK